MNLIQKIFNKLGFTVIKTDLLEDMKRRAKGEGPSTMMKGLMRARDRGLNPKTIIDVGAAKGVWTLKSRDIFKEADYVLFEPLLERSEELTELCKDPKIHHVNAAAGARAGEVEFIVTGDLDGSAVASKKSENTRTVPVVSVAEEMKSRNLSGPYILKLDTHGFEVPIIDGAVDILPETELVIIECYGFFVADDALLLDDMVAYMKKKGFRLIDMVDTLYRPNDKAFWQCDVFFAPESIDLFKSNKYF